MRWLTTPVSQSDDQESLLLPSSPPSGPTSPVSTYATLRSKETYKRILKLTWNLLRQLLIFCIPSFVRHPPTSNSSGETEKSSRPDASKNHSTAYLDGVRGLASFIVYIFHFTHLLYPGTNTGYGAKQNSSVWQLPGLRLIYSGAAMVSIFFVLSGYVLTRRFVQKMYRHEFDALFSGLTSLAFRRTLRLFLPGLASCLLYYMCVSLGLASLPTKAPDTGHEVHHGLAELMLYIDRETNPWTWDPYMFGLYGLQLWSVAVEYRGSMVVFLVVLSLARCRPGIRMAIESGIIAHAFGHKRWDIALFVAGMLVAELDVMVNVSTSRKEFMQRKLVKAVLSLSMFLGVWLSGFPRDRPFQSWGYGIFEPMWPFGEWRRRFWLAIGAILIVAPMPFLPAVQAVFSTDLMRYMGKISFALYLTQGLGNKTIGDLIIRLIWLRNDGQGYWNQAISMVVSLVLYTPIMIWWSDIFWRAFDLPANNFAKWFEIKCLSEPPT